MSPTTTTTVLRIARYTVRRRRLAPLTWGLPLSLMSIFVVAVFPSIERSTGFEDLLDSYPDALKEAFDVSTESFRTIEGYLNAEVLSLIGPLVAAAFLIRALSDAVCGAEARGTFDVLLTAPVDRRALVAGWWLGSVVVLVGILAVFWVVTMLAAVVAGVDLGAADLLAGTANLVPLAVFFGGVTLLAAGVLHRSGTVAGITAGVLLLMYLVEVLSGFSSALDAIAPLSAFRYYGVAIVDGIDLLAFVGLTAAGVLLAALGAVLFDRRDVG